VMHTGVLCSCKEHYVERDQSPWDKSEWLCDACHKALEQMKRDEEWIWKNPAIYPGERPPARDPLYHGEEHARSVAFYEAGDSGESEER
jgi:hypothetical protein